MKKINFTQSDLDFLNEDYSMNGVTMSDLKDICEEMIEDLDGTVDFEELESLYWWEHLQENLNYVENVRLKDKDDQDCFMYVHDIVSKLTKDEEYFENNSDELWTYFDDTEIHKFELDSNNELIIRLNITLSQLKKDLKYQYKD